jgi:hypothetical protein
MSSDEIPLLLKYVPLAFLQFMAWRKIFEVLLVEQEEENEVTLF